MPEPIGTPSNLSGRSLSNYRPCQPKINVQLAQNFGNVSMQGQHSKSQDDLNIQHIDFHSHAYQPGHKHRSLPDQMYTPWSLMPHNNYHTVPNHQTPSYQAIGQLFSQQSPLLSMDRETPHEQRGRFFIQPTPSTHTTPEPKKRLSPTQELAAQNIASCMLASNLHIQTPLDQAIHEEDGSDTETTSPQNLTGHPNKYPVEIESHDSKDCCYKRQIARSGYRLKQLPSSFIDGVDTPKLTEPQQVKYYQKDIYRVCHCNKYKNRENFQREGLSEELNGYEIHFSQKCKWKAYDDFKTGKRVLIRLCKCYKPTLA